MQEIVIDLVITAAIKFLLMCQSSALQESLIKYTHCRFQVILAWMGSSFIFPLCKIANKIPSISPVDRSVWLDLRYFLLVHTDENLNFDPRGKQSSELSECFRTRIKNLVKKQISLSRSCDRMADRGWKEAREGFKLKRNRSKCYIILL